MPLLFAIGPSGDQPGYLVEHAVDAQVNETMEAAKSVILNESARIGIDDIARDFQSRNTVK